MGDGTGRVWTSPGLDVCMAHCYRKLGFNLLNGGLPQRVLNVPGIVQEIRKRCPSKPFLDSEIPGIPIGLGGKITAGNSASDAAYAQSFLQVGQAYLSNGAASPGLPYADSARSLINGVPSELTPQLLDMQLQLRNTVP